MYPDLSTSAAYDITRKEFYAVPYSRTFRGRPQPGKLSSVGAISDAPTLL